MEQGPQELPDESSEDRAEALQDLTDKPLDHEGGGDEPADQQGGSPSGERPSE